MGLIDRATVDRIYAAADIVEIIGDYVTLKRKGVNYQACCPFHNEKTPSFVVSPSKGVFKCFGCVYKIKLMRVERSKSAKQVDDGVTVIEFEPEGI